MKNTVRFGGVLALAWALPANAVPDICDAGGGYLSGTFESETSFLKVEGVSNNDAFGRSMATGDFNNDGRADLVVGATGMDDNGTNTGGAYVFFGGLSDPTDPSTANVLLLGVHVGDFTGWAMTSGGDIDGDSFDDLVISTDPGRVSPNYQGTVYVVSGADIAANSVIDLSSADASIVGENNADEFGASIAVGDVTGDGNLDVIVGAPKNAGGANTRGAVYVFEGPVLGALSASGAHLKIDGPTDGSKFGGAVAAGLDVDGDGNGDLVVGAISDSRGGRNAGSTSVFLGGTGFVGSLDAAVDAAAYTVGSSYHRHGSAISTAGDLNGDGGDEFWSTSETFGSAKKGRAYLFSGGSLLAGPGSFTAEGINVAKLSGDNANDFAGSSVVGGIDIDQDGENDVVVGGERADGDALQSGATWVAYGPFLGTANLSDLGAKLGGANYNSFMGASVAVADLDNDGYDDVVSGAWRATVGTRNRGHVLMWRGGADTADLVTYYADSDGDGYGNALVSTEACSLPPSFSEFSTDCDDTSGLYYPGAVEGCSDPDYNCDTRTGNVDTDGDGFDACEECDDRTPLVNPDADEICGDGIDNDCDGAADDGNAIDAMTFCPDADLDGFGNDLACLQSCEDPGIFLGAVVNLGGDCDDSDEDVNPLAAEVCDLIDNNCDGDSDEATAIDALVWYADADLDSFGGYGSAIFACSQPAGHVSNADDCDDTRDSVRPGGLEVCDAIDNNCDGMHYQGGPSDVTTARMTLSGVSDRGEFGREMVFASDWDGDGTDELVIAAPGSSEVTTNGGVVFVRYGESHGGEWSFKEERADGSRRYQARIAPVRANSNLGSSVAVGDINGDGVDDLLIGASGTPAPQISRGAVYGFYGPVTGDLDTLDASFTIRGGAGGFLAGASVSVTDLDGDGFGDVVIGATGEEDPAAPNNDQGALHLFYGSSTLLGDLSTAEADATFFGAVREEQLGFASANAGDLDGDGIDDLVVSGAKGHTLEAGSLYFLYGNTTRHSGLITPDATVQGSLAVGSLGRRLSTAGDVNGDGFSDLLVGSESTRAYLLFGSSTRVADGVSNDVFDYSFVGPQTSRTGTFVSSAGDVNSDGLDDILIGALRDDSGANNGGATYLVYGVTDFAPFADSDGEIQVDSVESFARTEGGAIFPVFSASNLGVLEGARISGIVDGQNVGEGVVGGGDYNGDGVPDYAVAAPGWDETPSEPDVGQVFLFLGDNFGVDRDDEVDPLTKTTYTWDFDADTFVDDGESTFDACPLHLPISFRDYSNPVPRGLTVYDPPLDCNDSDHTVYPGAPEQQNDGVDSDCDSFDNNNRQPNLNLVINPITAYTSDDLTAVPNASDPDGDAVTVTYQWYLGSPGAEVPVVGQDSAVLTSTNFTKGERVTVEAWANDGRDVAGPFSASTTIRNSLPTLTECRISPSVGGITTEFSGLAVGLTDDDPADNALLSVGYQWFMLVGPFEVDIPNQTSQTLASCVDRSTGGGPYDCRRGSTILLGCEPSDPEGVGVALKSSQLVIANTPPTITTCQIEQATADTLTSLSVLASASDVDADLVTIAYEWIENSNPTGYVTSTYPASETEHFESIQVRCTPTDAAGDTGTPVTSAPLTISNTPPGSPVVNLTPAGPRSDQALTAIISTDAPDVDNDTITYIYDWTVDGSPFTNPGEVLPKTATARGELWEVTATAHDGFVTGGSDSAFQTVRNTPPAVVSVSLTPTSPDTEDTITAVAVGWSDEDTDPERYQVSWQVNGANVLAGENVLSLASSYYVRGDEVTVSITAIDSFDVGNTVSSSALEVVNATPTAPMISVQPTTPGEMDDLDCQLDVPSYDADNDPVTYTYTWFSDGPNTNIAGQVLSASNTSYAEVWYCTAQPNDGFENGDLGTAASVAIQDEDAPPAPTIDLTDSYRNEDSFELTGTCVTDINECNTMTLTCNDGFGAYAYTPACVGNSWSATVAVTRGRTASCSAICTDIGGNDSLNSNSVTTEVCDPSDSYDEEGVHAAGYGDSGTDPVDEWATLADDNSASLTITGNIVGNDTHDWYVVHTSDNPAADAAAGVDAYNFEIEMSVGSGNYELRAYVGSHTAPQECAVAGSYDDYSWNIEDTLGYPGDPGAGDLGHLPPVNPNSCSDAAPSAGIEGNWTLYNRCEDASQDFYVRLERALGSDCQPYTLRVFNGR